MTDCPVPRAHKTILLIYIDFSSTQPSSELALSEQAINSNLNPGEPNYPVAGRSPVDFASGLCWHGKFHANLMPHFSVGPVKASGHATASIWSRIEGASHSPFRPAKSSPVRRHHRRLTLLSSTHNSWWVSWHFLFRTHEGTVNDPLSWNNITFPEKGFASITMVARQLADSLIPELEHQAKTSQQVQ